MWSRKEHNQPPLPVLFCLCNKSLTFKRSFFPIVFKQSAGLASSDLFLRRGTCLFKIAKKELLMHYIYVCLLYTREVKQVRSPWRNATMALPPLEREVNTNCTASCCSNDELRAFTVYWAAALNVCVCVCVQLALEKLGLSFVHFLPESSTLNKTLLDKDHQTHTHIYRQTDTMHTHTPYTKIYFHKTSSTIITVPSL